MKNNELIERFNGMNPDDSESLKIMADLAVVAEREIGIAIIRWLFAWEKYNFIAHVANRSMSCLIGSVAHEAIAMLVNTENYGLLSNTTRDALCGEVRLIALQELDPNRYRNVLEFLEKNDSCNGVRKAAFDALRPIRQAEAVAKLKALK